MTYVLAEIRRVGQTVTQACVNGLATAGMGVVKGYCWTGRKVEWLCEKAKLPEGAAKVVSAFIWALPYMLLFLAVPNKPTFLNYLTSAVAVGLLAGVTAEIDGRVGEEHRQHMARGFRNAAIIKVGIDFVKMIVTRDISKLVPLLFNAEMADRAHKYTKPLPPPEAAEAAAAQEAAAQPAP